jgi:hypothetical protein
MKSKLTEIALRTIILVAALMVIGAVGIWLDLGPVAHSWPISY